MQCASLGACLSLTRDNLAARHAMMVMMTATAIHTVVVVLVVVVVVFVKARTFRGLALAELLGNLRQDLLVAHQLWRGLVGPTMRPWVA